MKHLSLDRPIVFFDLETTGVNVKADRIVEITVLKVFPDGSQEFKSTLINPEMPIPPQATAIHHINDADVMDKPQFKRYAKSVADFLTDCDIGGYNVKRFDLPMLESEFKRVGITFSRGGRSVIDAMVIFHKKEPRDLKAAYKRFCGKELVDGHRTEVDIRATLEILESQLGVYEDVPRDIKGLHQFCCAEGENEWVDAEGKLAWCGDEVIFNFGSHSGQSLKDVAVKYPDYLQWLIGKDFSEDLKQIVKEALNGIFPDNVK
jgi:DNA polymerase-3 subunit epsilon